MKRVLLFVISLLCFAPNVRAQQVSLTTTACPDIGCAQVSVRGQGSVGIQVTGTFSGTLQFEQTVDGVTWTTLSVLPNGSTTTVTSATAAGLWSATVAGTNLVRVRFSAYTSGTAVVSIVSAQAKVGLSGTCSTITCGDLRISDTTLTTGEPSFPVFAGATASVNVFSKNSISMNQVLAGATRATTFMNYYKFAPTDSDASGIYRTPLFSYIETGGSANLGSDIRGAMIRSINMNTGDGSINASSIYGASVESFNGHSGAASTGGKTTRHVGLFAAAYQQSDNATAVTDIRGLWTITQVDNGSVTTAYGHFVNMVSGGGTITTGYGHRIENVIGTTKWGYYNNSPTASSYSASNWRAPFIANDASSVLTSAATIAPTNGVHHVSGTAQIDTITVPAMCAPTCTIYLIPDGAFTTSTSGNVSLALTAVVNNPMIVVWDGTKWNPSQASAATIQPRASVYNSIAQTIPDSTETLVTFDSETVDIGGMHSTSVNTGRLTAPVDGTYSCTATVYWVANAVGFRSFNIRKNGTTFENKLSGPTTVAFSTSHTVWIDLVATDYIDMTVYQTSTGPLDTGIAAAPTTTRLSCVKIG